MKPSGAALLLSQVGTQVSARFAAAVGELGLTPAHVAVIRVVGGEGGLSQQALAGRLGVLPSKVVTLVDELESRGLLRRERSAADRRQYELHLASGGAADDVLATLRTTVGRHDQEVTAALTAEERTQLVALLRKVAASQGLAAGGHPGMGST